MHPGLLSGWVAPDDSCRFTEPSKGMSDSANNESVVILRYEEVIALKAASTPKIDVFPQHFVQVVANRKFANPTEIPAPYCDKSSF
jgi:hypothetical protein